MQKLVVVLGMSGLSTEGKLEKARAIVSKMTAHSHFTNPTPTLEEVNHAIVEAEKAFAAKTDGGKSHSLVLRDKIEQLTRLMKSLAMYVEGAADGSEALVLEVGMSLRRVTNRFKPLLEARTGEQSGHVKLICQSAGPRAAYVWEYAQQTSAEPQWVGAGITNVANNTLTELDAEKPYLFRVAVVHNSIQEPFSEAVRIVVL